jgi:hypothetical protein
MPSWRTILVWTSDEFLGIVRPWRRGLGVGVLTMRLVSLPTVVRALAIFLASLQTARAAAVQAQTYGEGQPQTSSVATLPLQPAPLGNSVADLSVFATERPGRLGAPALPAGLAWIGAGLVGATSLARSPRTSRGLELEALPPHLAAKALQRAPALRTAAGASNCTARLYPSAHRPRAPCVSLV